MVMFIKMNTFLQFIGILLLCLIPSKHAKFSRNIITTKENFAYVDRFCFVSEIGSLQYEFRYPKSMEVEKIYLYYDSPEQWPAVYKTGKTCFEKESVLRRENYQIMNLTTNLDPNSYGEAGCWIEIRDGQEWYTCKGNRRFSSYRERWWYIAVGNCANDSKGIYLEYDINMTNGKPENHWFYQFSADEFYILQVDITFLFLELMTLVAALAVAVVLRARQMLHTTFKLFLGSLSLEVCSLIMDCIAYGRYSRDGMGSDFVKFLGQMLRGGSRVAFLLMLILMGKGYTITRGRLSRKGTWKIFIFTTIYAIIYGALFIYQARMFDPSEVLYLYESPAGYGILIMGLVGWLWFCYAIYFTLIHYPEKRGFYLRFSVFFSIWFWMLPLMVMMSNHILPNHMREKIVNGLENAISFLGFAAFMVSLPHHTYEMRMSKLDEVFTVSGHNVDREMEEKKRQDVSSYGEEGSPLHEPPPAYDHASNQITT